MPIGGLSEAIPVSPKRLLGGFCSLRLADGSPHSLAGYLQRSVLGSHAPHIPCHVVLSISEASSRNLLHVEPQDSFERERERAGGEVGTEGEGKSSAGSVFSAEPDVGGDRSHNPEITT